MVLQSYLATSSHQANHAPLQIIAYRNDYISLLFVVRLSHVCLFPNLR